MKSISKLLMVTIMLLSSIYSFGKIAHAKTEKVTVYGNCAICKATIEKAGNQKNTATVAWSKDTKIATLIYDSVKTNPGEILKRIALAGYDNEQFRAPDDVYGKLADCCKYDRPLNALSEKEATGMNMKNGNHLKDGMNLPANTAKQNQSALKPVFENYFSIKEALVKTDPAMASSKAAELAASINSVDMNRLSAEEHGEWMKVMEKLRVSAEYISKSTDVSRQRDAFAKLSENIYELVKVSKQDDPVYYQHCPMYNGGKGANWLSKQNTIKNPYYGAQMISCGSTVETIKP